MFHAVLVVKPKPGVRDPQGAAVEEAMQSLDYTNIHVLSVGRVLTMELSAGSEAEARAQVDDLCRRLLVNPNLETYDLTFQHA